MSTLRNTIAAFVAAGLLSWCASASAMLPDSGWYWNKAQSGRGFNIEIQNNVLFMSAFIYDVAKNPIWLVAGGPMSSDADFSGDLYQTSNGQCIGCAYVPPSSSKWGTVAIHFSSPMKATITINGVAIAVERQPFGMDLTEFANFALGEWALVNGSASSGVYTGERITLSSTFVNSSSEMLIARGSRTGDAARTALAAYYSVNTLYIMVDSSTTTNTLYLLSVVGTNRLEGQAMVYAKGTPIPKSGPASQGFRIKSAALVAGGNAPGVSVFGAAPDAAARSAQAGEGVSAIQAAPVPDMTTEFTADQLHFIENLAAELRRIAGN